MSLRRTLLTVALVALASITLLPRINTPMQADQLVHTPTGFLYKSLNAQGREYPYSVYVPRDYGTRDDWPVILFLHGRGESGTDGSKQMAVGIGDPMIYAPHEYPFVVIFPQKPDHNSQWEDHEEAVMKMLDAELDLYNVDRSRVYLTGLSQGGHGTWSIGSKHPDRFAALAPVCGYVERPYIDAEGHVRWAKAEESAFTAQYAEALKHTPVWAFHGELDDVVVPSESVTMIKAIREARSSGEDDSNTKLTLYPKANHNSWDQAYRERELFEWFLSHQIVATARN
ncbi:MAG: prolyl oligopeptidase family serine peptidase [Planctomycetota bacterium]